MLKQGAAILAGLLIVATNAQAQALPQLTNDTTWDGETLSQWIADLSAAAPYSRHKAAYAISSMGPAAAAAVPALIETLQDPSAPVRYAVAYALSEIGPAAAAAIPALTEALDDPNDDVAFMAKKALKSIEKTPS